MTKKQEENSLGNPKKAKKLSQEALEKKVSDLTLANQTLLNQYQTLKKYVHEHQEAVKKAQKNYVTLSKTVTKLTHLAHHDLITQLPNRFLFEHAIQEKIEKAKRKQEKLALLYLDLDHFKLVNDRFGHNIGDLLLKYVALRLKNNLRIDDFLARLGGDEFIIILENIRDDKNALIVAESLLEAIRIPYSLEGHTICISVSIGIACYPESALDGILLCKNADTAMYRSKEMGRDTYQCFSQPL